jgi:uncharacterized protein
MPPIGIGRLLIILVMNTLVGYYIIRKFATLISRLKPKRERLYKTIATVVISVLMVLPMVSLLTRRVEAWREEPVTYFMFTLSSVWFVWVISLLAVFVPFDVWKYGKRLVHGVMQRVMRRSTASVVTTQPTDESRRKFLTTLTAGAAPMLAGFAVPTVITAYSVLNNRTDYVINEMTLKFPDLPSELRGLKIAQVSDIHSGIYMPEHKMAEIAESVNGFSPDLVALTGDFVSTFPDEITPFIRGFQNLKSTFGTFACAGNHEEYAGLAAITEALKEGGINILRNEATAFDIGGEKLNILGMDFTKNNTRFLETALKQSCDEGFKLLLCHHPDFFTHAKTHAIDLMLAGHTHGGQIALDFGGLEFYPIDLFYKYPRGLFEEGENNRQKLYVNLGIGITGTPLRTVQPEIAVITLERG